MKEIRRINPLVDKDPYTGNFFQNPMLLRMQKLKAMLSVKNRVTNAFVVNYETVKKNATKWIEQFANATALQIVNKGNVLLSLKNGRIDSKYYAKHYQNISDIDATYINSYLQVTLENSIGYPILYNSKEIFARSELVCIESRVNGSKICT